VTGSSEDLALKAIPEFWFAPDDPVATAPGSDAPDDPLAAAGF
jgi:hypothetical protein